jgi:hypothetical protein
MPSGSWSTSRAWQTLGLTPEPSFGVLARSAQPACRGRVRDRSVGRWLPPTSSFACGAREMYRARAAVADSAPSLRFLAGGSCGALPGRQRR